MTQREQAIRGRVLQGNYPLYGWSKLVLRDAEELLRLLDECRGQAEKQMEKCALEIEQLRGELKEREIRGEHGCMVCRKRGTPLCLYPLEAQTGAGLDVCDNWEVE